MIERYRTAFQFLTAIPLFPARKFEDAEMGRAMAAFPLVGATLGLLLAGFYVVAGKHLPPLFGAVLLTGFLALMTGGFHLDGLADTVDGLAGGWTRERALEIMKDSRVGAMGAAAIALVLLAKAAALSAFAPEEMFPVLLVFPAVGRTAPVFLAWNTPYARPTPGLGSPYAAHLDDNSGLLALGFGAACSAAAGWAGLAAWLAAVVWAAVLKAWFKKRLGGVTGDVLGFSAETAEVVALTVLLLLRETP